LGAGWGLLPDLALIYLCVTPEREEKTFRLMNALHCGDPETTKVVRGAPPKDDCPFVVWGQRWTAEDVLPEATLSGRGFWHIDNGYYLSAGGRPSGYYRITYRGMTPVDLAIRDKRLPVSFEPWRRSGKHIVLAMPGDHYGRPLGININRWKNQIRRRILQNTDRKIVVRSKSNRAPPLAHDLEHAWALVTHSSTAAVDAARFGVPVFVEPTSAAAPVGNLDLSNIECPTTPGRSQWWRSLMWQQFTIHEMKSGLAWKMMLKMQEKHRAGEIPWGTHRDGNL